MTPSELGIEIEHALLVSVLGEQCHSGCFVIPHCWVKVAPSDSLAAGFGSPIPSPRWARHCIAYSRQTGHWMHTGPDGTCSGWRFWPSLFDYLTSLKDEQL